MTPSETKPSTRACARRTLVSARGTGSEAACEGEMPTGVRGDRLLTPAALATADIARGAEPIRQCPGRRVAVLEPGSQARRRCPPRIVRAVTEIQHRYVGLGEVTLHVASAGEGGRPLVLLHGFPQTWYSWHSVIPLLVERGFHCIAPDLRGLGDSTRPLSGYSKKTVAGDIHELVTGHFGIPRFAVVGHDWGGTVGYALAAHFPPCVTHLAVLDVSIPGDGAPDLSMGGRRWHHQFFRTPDLPEALIVGREEILLRWFFENYGDNPGAISEDYVQEYLRTYRKPGAIRAGLAYYRSIQQDIDDNEGTPRLTVPCLAIGGGTSMGRGAVVEESLRRMAENVTGLILPGCGHWIPEERPHELAAALGSFLADDVAARGAIPGSEPTQG